MKKLVIGLTWLIFAGLVTYVYTYDTHMHTRTHPLTHMHAPGHTHMHVHRQTDTHHTFPSGETAKDVTVSSFYKHYLIIKENMITVSYFFQMPCYSTSFTIHYLHTYST